MTVRPARPARPADQSALVDLWQQGWHDGHAGLVPQALADLRTRETFETRAADHLSCTWVVDNADGTLAGLFMVQGDELYQFYVARSARGTGVAAAMMDAALDWLRQAGTGRGWLLCAAGNERAARFYRKCGWHLAAEEIAGVETASGPFEITAWRFEIALG